MPTYWCKPGSFWITTNVPVHMGEVIVHQGYRYLVSLISHAVDTPATTELSLVKTTITLPPLTESA